MRQITPVDKVILLADNLLKTLFGGYQTTQRANPATIQMASNPSDNTEFASIDLNNSNQNNSNLQNIAESKLTSQQAKHSAGLMRINHCGEVCAQALYQGQALTAKLPDVRLKMEQAAVEENDHLDWCATRLHQLDSHTSRLNPLWYVGSFTIGAIAGALGDKWSLGFVAETELQVVRHLDEHLIELPENDHQSRAILTQMREDELVHATSAISAGGAELPGLVKQIMGGMSKVMTSSVYYI